MPIDLIDGETQCLIRLEGEVGIESAAELKAMIARAISSGKECQFEMESATDLDVTAVQLLWCAVREAPKDGIGCAVVNATDGIRAAVREMGLDDVPGIVPATAFLSSPSRPSPGTSSGKSSDDR